MSATYYQFLLLAFLLGFNLQEAASQEPPYRPAKINQKIEVDGALDDSSWQHTPVFSKFVQIDPTPGGKPAFRTEIKLLYNDNYLYVGVKCFDPDPDKLIATAMERDSDVEEDDAIMVIIDSYNDNLNGTVFATNPLGVRQDFEISQNGQGLNYSFNTFWNVVVQTDATGWSAEFSIPFSSLRFVEEEEVIMGLKAIRITKRKGEYSVFPPYNSDIADPYYRLDLATSIAFRDLKSRKPLYFSPYTIVDLSEEKVFNPSTNDYDSDFNIISRKNYTRNPIADRVLSNIGADLKVGLSKNFTLDLSLNTDFAQAEVDDRVLNISRFNVYLPEKRGFFLESEDYFNLNMGATRLFFSRNIGRQGGLIIPLLGGARLTGQVKGYQVGLLNMQTIGYEQEDIPSQNFTVFRVKKNLYDNGSYLGGILTNRMSTTDQSISNQVLGLDYLHRLSNKWVVSTAVSASADNITRQEPDEKNLGTQLRLAKFSTQKFSHVIEWNYLGENFSPGIGFLRYSNLSWFVANNGYTWQLENNKTLANLKLENASFYAVNATTGAAEFYYINLSPVVQFKNGAAVKFTPVEMYRDTFNYSWNMNQDLVVPAGDYNMYYSTLFFLTPGTKRYRGEVFGKFGDFYGGKITNFFLSGRFNINKHFQFRAYYEYTKILFPETFSISGNHPLYSTNLISLNLQVQLNSRISFKTLVQYDDLSNVFGSNLRFRYNPREGTDLYVVLNHNLNTLRTPLYPESSNRPLVERQSLVIKFIKTFNLSNR